MTGKSSPRQSRFHQPAEWAAQTCCWTAWPHLEADWGAPFVEAKEEVAAFVRTLAQHQPVRVLVRTAEDRELARLAIAEPRVELLEMAFGDIWMRDTGPVFLLGPAGELGAACFRFNGWGGKYLYEHDDVVKHDLVKQAGARAFQLETTLEGGGLEVDGEGTCLTTRQCALNPNRNKNATEASIEWAIAEALGVERVLWLDEGLANDHTDGHIDTLARFVSPGVVVCMEPASGDPNADVLRAILTALRGMRDAKGRRLEVLTMPSPGSVTLADGTLLPASYANFYIGNGVVVVPTYGVSADDGALRALESAFPGRRVVGAKARAILSGGGALHCITQQEPGPRRIT